MESSNLVQIVKSIEALDLLIRSLKSVVPNVKPWQQQLVALLNQADQQMLILRLNISIERPDVEICASARALASVCSKMPRCTQGVRTDETVRAGALMLARSSKTLADLFQGS